MKRHSVVFPYATKGGGERVREARETAVPEQVNRTCNRQVAAFCRTHSHACMWCDMNFATMRVVTTDRQTYSDSA